MNDGTLPISLPSQSNSAHGRWYTAGWPFIHWNEILPRIHFFSRHQLPFINAGRVGCSIPPIPGRDFFNDKTLRPAPVLAIHPDGSLCHQSYEINRPDLPLCIGFDHAIHLVFLLILTRTNSCAMHLSTRICCRTPDSRINYDRIFILFFYFSKVYTR
jgi:hypothetical protein